MFTLFTTMKPFRGHDGVTQRNAIKSWTLLDPAPEILLMGDGPGYGEVAREFGLRHLPDVEVNERGLPYLSDMFARAQAEAKHPLVCSLDGDVILLPDFNDAVRQVQGITRPFLMIGKTWTTPQTTPLDTSAPDWAERLRARARSGGRTHGSWYGMDYFLFPKGAFPSFPRMVVGRPGWDNYLVYDARARGLMVIDASQVVDTVHQDHAYEHAGGTDVVWKGPESRANIALMSPEHLEFSAADATHVLSSRGLQRARGAPYSYRRWYTLPIVRRRWRFLRPLFRAARWATRPVRRAAGITVEGGRKQ